MKAYTDLEIVFALNWYKTAGLCKRPVFSAIICCMFKIALLIAESRYYRR